MDPVDDAECLQQLNSLQDRVQQQACRSRGRAAGQPHAAARSASESLSDESFSTSSAEELTGFDHGFLLMLHEYLVMRTAKVQRLRHVQVMHMQCRVSKHLMRFM